ncbi:MULTISPECIES: hypothetical protein [unclassified Rhizobium]|jgi:hypothetical protein|uniref:hypothetical protein n=1 Tax=unclassified Rhizobium TaxID=2613769 RepID=UPI000646BF95|nr:MULTISPECIES: hypothetical protein [unclassified Rhizobium]MBN8953400.1 histidine phosphatase family protein [Rhizobium tropici]OJY74412.1 MAG: hypothetical protein BGP09_18235 [Rhizobium sp. 60-20]RKD67997.1 hypothetical protein BJ928_105400 [Rhizobium sp. WW_1]
MRIRLVSKLLTACLTSLMFSELAIAQPAQIIIARHAEKLDPYALCDMGVQRSQALAQQYLGRGASQSLFGTKGPDAILAIGLHPIETSTPAAQSWGMPVIAYTALPVKGEKGRAATVIENLRTQQAARDVLSEPLYDSKTVLMVWEHDHIAKAKLEREFPGEKVTLRQLLHLDQIAGVPDTWPDATYDYFWIIDYAPGNPVPVKFRMERQVFAPPFDSLPTNDWGEAEPNHITAGCLK